MKVMWKMGMAFLLSLLAGFMIAKSWRSDAGKPDEVARNPLRVVEKRRERWRSEDLLNSLRTLRSLASNNPLEDEMKGWADEEIHAALDQGLSNPECALPTGSANDLLRLLFGEWMKRDADAALTWFEAIPSNSRKTDFAGALSERWPKERAAEGLDYVCKHRGIFETREATCSGKIIQAAIESAASKGPAAVEKVLKQLRENQLTPRYVEGWQFPKGFDFATLAASPEAKQLKQGYAFYAGVWMSQNREEAFQHLVASGDGQVSVRNLFADVMPQNGAIDHKAAAERAEWFAGKLVGIEEQRRRMLAAQAVETFEDAPEALAAFTVSLTHEPDRRDVSSNALKALVGKSMDTALSYLEATSPPEQRLAALEAVEVDAYRRWWPNEAWERKLRQRLESWNATEERADAIVRQLKEVRR